MKSEEKCPICGTLNKNLDLEETNGWFECECCNNTVNTLRIIHKIPLYKMEEKGIANNG